MSPAKPPTRWTRWLPLLYLVFGVAWILASDSVVGWMFGESPHLLLLVSTAKGFAFVALTALMLALWWRAEQRHNQALLASAEARASFATERMAWMSRHAHDVILLLDEDGRILDCNDRAEQMYGYPREQLLRMSVMDLRDARTLPAADDQLRSVLSHGRLAFETQHRTRDGRVLPVEVSSSGVEFQGRTYVQSIIRDQTELLAARRRAERQRDLYDMLSRCNHLIARATDRTQLCDAVVRLAVEHGRFLFASLTEPQADGSVRTMASYGPDDGYLAQKQVSLRPEDPEGRGPTGRCLRDGVTMVVNQYLEHPDTAPWHEMARRVGINGSAAVPVRLRGQVVAALNVYATEVNFFDADIVATLEEVAAEIGFGLDALEVRKELEESRNLLQTVIDASATPMYVFDREGRALLINEACARVLGLPRAKILGATRDVALSPEDVAAHLEADRKVFASGQALYVDESVGTGAAQRAFLSVKFPLRDLAGNVYAVGGVSTDITELRRAQREVTEANTQLEQVVATRTQELVIERDRAEQADRAKTAFLSTVSHELRTPLNSILGFTEIVLRELTGPLNDEQRRQLTIVHDSSRQLLDLINEILDLSRIEAGRMQFTMESFDAAELLRRRLEALASQAGQKGLELREEFAADLGPMTSDPKRVAQIISNLLSNAVKFTEQGSVVLRARRHDDDIEIEVQDTGPGIAPEDLAHLFKPFMQVGEAQRHHREGTGLGLAISRHLAQALGGTIDVSSELGRGTTFRVILPAHAPARPELAADTGLFHRLTSPA